MGKKAAVNTEKIGKSKKSMNFFTPPKGKYRFWTPKYVCETPKSLGCKTKKTTTVISFALLIASIILNAIWIIEGVYISQTGNEFLGYTARAYIFTLGILFGFIWIVMTIVNYSSREKDALKNILIALGVIGAIWLISYLLLM